MPLSFANFHFYLLVLVIKEFREIGNARRSRWSPGERQDTHGRLLLPASCLSLQILYVTGVHGGAGAGAGSWCMSALLPSPEHVCALSGGNCEI